MIEVIRFVNEVICTAGGIAALIVSVPVLLVWLAPGLVIRLLRGRGR